ncbi:MAG: CHAT domain-containing protein [Oscillatoriales cyanobacterium RM2_1_1]|nr:CHAT domain-containing protein [Oscillatoriales cyanobacterium RM2_1_1]
MIQTRRYQSQTGGQRRSRWCWTIILGCLTCLLVVKGLPVAAIAPMNSSELSSLTPVAQSPAALLDQGRQLYTIGRFTDAKTIWEQATQAFQQNGDVVGQAWALSYLSLAQQALGEWIGAETAIDQSLAILAQFQHREAVNLLAQALTTQGQLYRRQGKTSQALESWEAAETAYRQAGDSVGILGSQINQAQALRAMGLYRRSRKVLTSVQADLQSQPDSLLKAKGLQSLGVTLQLLGDSDLAGILLQQSLEIAQALNSPPDITAALLDLGNLAQNLQQPEKALNYYQQAGAIAPTPELKLKAQLNQLRWSVELQAKTSGTVPLPIQLPAQQSDLMALIQNLATNLATLPPSQASVYGAVNFAESLMNLPDSFAEPGSNQVQSVTENALTNALTQAQTLGNPSAEAAVLTQLGQLYEQTQQFSQALTLTETALQIAQQTHAPEITAQASWQLGRLLKQQGDLSTATIAYRVAFKTLQDLRSDLVVNPDVLFSFTETIEPVYREFVSLLLQTATPELSEAAQANLREAQAVIEALQVAELDNFFQEACLETKPTQIGEIDPSAAVIYPIILPDRLEVIAALPQQPLKHYSAAIAQAQLIPRLREMRQSLHPAYDSDQRLQLYQQAYDWLIRPVQTDLAQAGIKTLVFFLDSELRNLPMAALYDGQQYLLEQYGVAVSPGLQLLESRPTVLENDAAITAGLSEARQGFLPLPGVKQEIQQISAEVAAEVILNQAFTTKNLEAAIESSSARILHLATHGQFSSDARKTFVLTWDGRINVKDFDELLRSRQGGNQVPVDLLVLSACQTALGDRRAALGLAGMAVRSGARSTVASLWAVWDDSTTDLMVEFYKQLEQPGVTKAEALRQAQLTLLQGGKYSHPVYWAPFILVGNWL